jgi:hypothetical protein
MEPFSLYFGLGREHILDPNGYDHILFVIALCAAYPLSEWKRVIILVTAFTVGHSITLALATLGIVQVHTQWVEFLIPLTILVTAFANLFKSDSSAPVRLSYALAVFFGLIHGLGFSAYLRSLLGRSAEIFTPLLAFNLGLELGQIIIVIVYIAVTFIFVGLLGIDRRDWRLVASSAIGGIALLLLRDRIFW